MRTNSDYRIWCFAALLGLSCGGEDRAPPLADEGESMPTKGAAVPTYPRITADAGLRLKDAGHASTTAAEADGGDGGETNAFIQVDAAVPEGPFCGDGTWDPATESCDGQEPARTDCSQLGFDLGQLRCNSRCEWDPVDCSGSESCSDGIDNDGDTLVDCDDTEDCATFCANSCDDLVLLEDDQQLSGALWNHQAAASSRCDETGVQKLVYEFYSHADGELDFALSSDDELSISVLRACASGAGEIACGGRTRLTIDALEDESYFVEISGRQGKTPSRFQLSIVSRQAACGDGIRSRHERCDDGNINDGDGCDPDCNLESDEDEPQNDTAAGANPLAPNEPVYAEVYPEGDVDTFEVRLETRGWLRAEVSNLGDGACALGLMTPTIEIRSEQGASLVSNAEQAPCAAAGVGPLEAGVYLIGVTAHDTSARATFPYQLRAATGACGEQDPCDGQ